MRPWLTGGCYTEKECSSFSGGGGGGGGVGGGSNSGSIIFVMVHVGLICCGILSSVFLHTVHGQVAIDVSAQHIGSIFKDQDMQ